MKYKKGDYIDSFKVLLPLKEAKGIETYRARDTEGRLCALKYGVSTQELNIASHTRLFIASGKNYVVYRYISGETLEAKLSRDHRCSVFDTKKFTIHILTQLSDIHAKGYTHAKVTADNIMIDLGGSEVAAWLIGYSSTSKSEDIPVNTDLQAVGTLMYRMIFGEMPDPQPRIRAGNVPGLDEDLLNIMYKAMAADFSSAQEMKDSLEGKIEVKPMRKLSGPGFSAVAGMEDIKRKLQEDVIDILADREGAERYGIHIPNGMLLYGPPGCGKTFIAERFAEQASYNYQYVKSSDLASTYLHGSQEKIASLFDEARKNAPTILCFDEFDALVPRRDDINNASQSAEVNEFLSQLNNCGKDGVFVIATTNRPDKIDSAILRTGRIDYMIYVPIPDEKAREAMFRLALKNKPIDNDIDYTYLSQNTDGYLSSDISAIVYDAARMAFREKDPISMSLLKNALASRKPSLSRTAISDYEKLRQEFEHQKEGKRKIKVGFI